MSDMFGTVFARYVGGMSTMTGNPYDQLWLEEGHYTSFSGEDDFHGKREIPKGTEIQERLAFDQSQGYDGDIVINRITIPAQYRAQFKQWLDDEIAMSYQARLAKPKPVEVTGTPEHESLVLTADQWRQLKELLS